MTLRFIVTNIAYDIIEVFLTFVYASFPSDDDRKSVDKENDTLRNCKKRVLETVKILRSFSRLNIYVSSNLVGC